MRLLLLSRAPINFRLSWVYRNSLDDSDAYLTEVQVTRLSTSNTRLASRDGPSCRLFCGTLSFRSPEQPRVSNFRRRHHVARYGHPAPFQGRARGIGPGSGLQAALLIKPRLATRDVRQFPFRLCRALGTPARRLRTLLLASGLKEPDVAMLTAAHWVSRVFPGGRVFQRILVTGYCFPGDQGLLRLIPGRN